VDLASIEVKVPDITTNGSKSGNSVTSTGRDDILSAKIDIDGVASINGVLPPTGISFDLIDKGSIKIGGSLDLIDVDAGPVLGIAQDFKLTPTLMVNLDFSELVKIQEDTEVLAITTLDGETVAEGTPGPIWKQIDALYQDYKEDGASWQ